MRKYEILSNLEEIGKDWTVFGGENEVLFPIAEKFFPIWRKLERIGDLITGRGTGRSPRWRTPVAESQTVLGHAVCEFLQVSFQRVHHLLQLRRLSGNQIVFQARIA